MISLLLMFLLVTAKPIKEETDSSMALPDTAPQEETLNIPDEEQLTILAETTVALDKLPVATPANRKML